VSGTVTVRELIVELLEEDMNDKVYIGNEDDDWEHQEICYLGSSNINERPHGVYLFSRKRDDS